MTETPTLVVDHGTKIICSLCHLPWKDHLDLRDVDLHMIDTVEVGGTRVVGICHTCTWRSASLPSESLAANDVEDHHVRAGLRYQWQQHDLEPRVTRAQCTVLVQREHDRLREAGLMIIMDSGGTEVGESLPSEPPC